MGNRATIIFKGEADFGVYIHWNGGPESVYAFIKLLASYQNSYSGHTNDKPIKLTGYSNVLVARFNQLVCNFFNASRADFLNIEQFKVSKNLAKHISYDNGLYVINPDYSITRYFHAETGGAHKMTDIERLVEFAKVLSHDYWSSTNEKTIMSDLREKNDRIFLNNNSKKFKFREYSLPIELELAELDKKLGYSLKDAAQNMEEGTIELINKVELDLKIQKPNRIQPSKLKI